MGEVGFGRVGCWCVRGGTISSQGGLLQPNPPPPPRPPPPLVVPQLLSTCPAPTPWATNRLVHHFALLLPSFLAGFVTVLVFTIRTISHVCRHFNVLVMPPFAETTMKQIFHTLLEFVLTQPGWGPWAHASVAPVVDCTLRIFRKMCEELLPTPAKSHYTFNLRDISKVFQGMSLAAPEAITETGQLHRLWLHECHRTFADRLSDDADRERFVAIVSAEVQAVLRVPYESIAEPGPLLFATFVRPRTAGREYVAVEAVEPALRALETYLEVCVVVYLAVPVGCVWLAVVAGLLLTSIII